MKFGMGDIMKQAQEVQQKIEQIKQEIANMEITGEAGAGMVTVVMTGQHDVKRISIDDSLLDADKEMLEDLVAAAVNDANRRVEKASQEKMSELTQGLNLPAGMNLPF